MKQELFTFQKDQIFYELLHNLIAQRMMDEKWCETVLTNDGALIKFTLYILIPYRNLLLKTGGAYQEIMP